MREILFKAKTKLEVGQNNCGKQDGVWVFGFYRDRVARPTISQFEFDRADYLDYEVDRETLCQYTGLKDRNGNKIFENDILDYWENGKENIKQRLKVFYENGQFVVDHYAINLLNSRNMSSEIIGNIFDNKELLGDKV